MLHKLQGSARCLQYAQRALLINEFTAGRWQNGKIYPGTGPYSGQTLGNGILSQFGFPGELSPKLTRASVYPDIFPTLYMFCLCIPVANVSSGTRTSNSMLYSSPQPWQRPSNCWLANTFWQSVVVLWQPRASCCCQLRSYV